MPAVSLGLSHVTDGPVLWMRQIASPSGRRNLAYDVRRWLVGRRALPDTPLRRIVVICQGNICRSPFAAALLAQRAPELEVRGAGIAAASGETAQPGALRMAPRFGVQLDDHRSDRLTLQTLDWADLILGMEGQHVRAVRTLSSVAEAKTFILGEFMPDPPYLIPDPWGLPDVVFGQTFERIASATDSVIEAIRRHNRSC
jgi:protein-tyrosine phosphatase